jgi:hypothetical protein
MTPVKIKGPGGPTVPPDVDQAGEKGKTEGTSGKTFADALGEPTRTGGPTGPGGPGGADPVGQVAADLKAGRISPKQAVERLVDLTMVNGPAAALPAGVQAKIRADLENLMKEDPFLRSKLDKIGVPHGDDE